MFKASDPIDETVSRCLLILLFVTLVLILGSRVVGPSDLYDQDQPKTVTYTVDMVEHGHWLLPEDMLARPSTKPPMYNWIGAPFYAVIGPAEWVLKIPSVLAGLSLLTLIFAAGRSLFREADISADPLPGNRLSDALAAHIALVAGVLWLANYAGLKLIYLARPDMVLTAFLVAGWFIATRLLTGPPDDRPGGKRLCWQLALWVCVAAAGLSKGPPALLVVLYCLIGAPLLTGRWRTLARTGIHWGLPLALGLVALWLWAAWMHNPEHVRQVFFGDETVSRVSGGPGEILGELWRMPAWLLACFAPWSFFAVLTLIHLPPRRWLRHPLAPAIVWLLLVLVFFSLSAGKRADYLAPAYPAAALLAAYWLVVVGSQYALTPVRVACLGVLVAAGLAFHPLGFSPAAQTGFGQHIKHFAKAVRDHAAPEHGIAFIDTGYTPLQALLGQSAGAHPADARWIIRPIHGDADEAVVISDLLYDGLGDQHPRFGLFSASGMQSADASLIDPPPPVTDVKVDPPVGFP